MSWTARSGRAGQAARKLVITDSQAFARPSGGDTPEDMPLTSFSILMARYKGILADGRAGRRRAGQASGRGHAFSSAEGCTHHRQCEDIGTVKLPELAAAVHRRRPATIDFTSGGEFPEDLSPYALVIHCGGCMLNEREMQSPHRVTAADCSACPSPTTASPSPQMHGILARSLGPFPHLAALLTP